MVSSQALVIIIFISLLLTGSLTLFVSLVTNITLLVGKSLIYLFLWIFFANILLFLVIFPLILLIYYGTHSAEDNNDADDENK